MFTNQARSVNSDCLIVGDGNGDHLALHLRVSGTRDVTLHHIVVPRSERVAGTQAVQCLGAVRSCELEKGVVWISSQYLPHRPLL